ncbi:MAG: hypothetical protein HFG28_01765 [Eubacterium sp.]|nr:hypothetical protein [Eubacterium sp.]
MTTNRNKKYNRIIISFATLLILMCLVFIVMLLKAATERSFLVVFVIAFAVAIAIIFFTAKDMLK